MNHVLRRDLLRLGFLMALLTGLMCGVPWSAAQERGGAVRIEAQDAGELQPLTAAERQQTLTVLQSDSRARRSVVGSERLQTIFVERYEEDKDAPTGTRRAHVVLYNYDTQETISAVVALEPRPLVESLSITTDQPPGLSAQEVQEAKRLALAHPAVQDRLRAAGHVRPAQELIITHLLARASAPDDPCTTHRCVALFFNTREAVLGIEPVVDLSTGNVELP